MPAENQVPMVENQQIKIYYQRSTTNQSFLEMSDYLQRIGIRNNRFMLALLDPDLANIDPHDPNLPAFYKTKVLLEVRNNFWYFVREVVRIPSSGGPSKFILTRGNMAFLYLASMNINTIQIQPRQTGKTIGSAVYLLYVYNYRTASTFIPICNKEFRDSKLNLARIREIRDLLPPYLRFDAIYSEVNGKKKKVSSTATFMENAMNHNKIQAFAKARNELSAANLLRGLTFSLFWADEFSFIPFFKTVYGNMIPAMSKATEIARMNNVPYGLIYSTTPGFLTTDEGKYAYDIVNAATPWNEMWYDLGYQQILGIIESNRRSNFVFIQYTYQQLGYSEEWFYERCKEANWEWPLIRREYLLEWSDEAENNPFTKEELDTVRKFCREPLKTVLIFKKYELKIFKEIPLKANLVPKYPPIIGVDPSGGVSKDWSCLTFVDSKTTEVFAELRCNSISLIDLARVIENIVLTMMPNAIINIERNGGFGLAVIGKLKETQVKKNLYYEIKDKVVEEVTINGRLERKSRRIRVYGLQSTHDVRNQLIELLRERMSFHKDKFISPTIYKELTGLEVKKNGKVEHSDLTHDDQIFSYLMAMYVWYDGKNLRENFGLEKFGIRTEESIDEEIEMATGPSKQADMTQYMVAANQSSEDKGRLRVAMDLAQMKKGKGMMFSEFVAQQRTRETEHLRWMLRDPRYREAYARYYGVPVESVDSEVGKGSYDDRSSLMPNSLFMDFNKDPEEMDEGSIYHSMPSPYTTQYGSMPYPEDETQQ